MTPNRLLIKIVCIINFWYILMAKKRLWEESPLNWYFETKGFEEWGKVYERLWVNWARSIVNTIWKLVDVLLAAPKGSANNYSIGKKHTIEALERFEKNTRFNEIIHAPSLPFHILPIYRAIKDADRVLLSIMIGLFWGNLYTTMIQRYNRAKITKVLNHKKTKRTRKEIKD